MSEFRPSKPGRAYIVRGVQGSGKSTVAKDLVASAGSNGRIHSTDDYFLDDQGNYNFDPRKLPQFHARNLAAFEESLKAGLDIVVCDNTNSKRWEYYRYMALALKYGYIVAVVALPHPDPEIAAKRNKHGVPQAVIEKMIANWEQ
ncbi:MAG: ATP-binding protein [Candidatus Vogelbacteria bacterium]|nr:ATP-binding protein [Candidatus Vogelbacteria bacterium]